LLVDVVTAPYDLVNWITDLVFIFLHGLFNQYGTPIVFLAAIAEATIGLGLVFPGVLFMFLGGAAAAQGELRVEQVLLAAVVGTVIGDTLSYAAGRWGAGWALRTRFGPSLRLGGEMMRGRGRWFIPFYHFHNITRSVGAFGAGLIRLPILIWAPLDFLGVLIANAVFVGAGYLLGTYLLTPEGTIQPHPAIRLGLGAVGVVYLLLMARAYRGRVAAHHRREAQRARGVTGAPVTPAATSSSDPRE
jgi:membrane protein DedA with SNARE-associated domain